MKGLLFTYALVALGAFGAFKMPLIGLAVYICFAVLRPQFLWSFAGDLSGISFYVGLPLVIAWVLHGTGSWRFKRGTIIVAALLLFAVWATISGFLAPNQRVARFWVDNLWKFVVPFLIGVTMIRTHEWARRMLWIIVLSLGYVGYEMNLSYLQGINRIQEFGYGGMDNNSFGIALVAGLGPALMLGMVAKSLKARVIAMACAGMILHTVLLTFSRGAMLGLVVVAITAFIIIPKRPRHLAVMLGVILLTVRLTGPELLARYQTIFVAGDARDGSAQSRVDLWKDCLTVALDYPIFGVGPDHWRIIAPQYGWTFNKSAHSVWMQTMAELGFPGVFWLAAFLGLAFVKLWPIARTRNKDPVSRERAAMATGVMLAIVGYSVSGQFVSLPGLEVIYYIVMVGVALIVVPGTAEAAQPARAAVPDARPARMSALPAPAGPGLSNRGGL